MPGARMAAKTAPKMTVKKTTVKMTPKSTTVTKKTVPVTPATRAKFTDMEKKKDAIKGGPGVKVAPKGTAMGEAQRTEAKRKVAMYQKKHGVFPTPENVKKYGSKY